MKSQRIPFYKIVMQRQRPHLEIDIVMSRRQILLLTPRLGNASASMELDALQKYTY